MKIRLVPVTAALGMVALAQPYRPYVVSGESMSPTFATGQVLIGNIRPRAIERGDVVVFHRDGETMVKRVAFLAGDSIERFWYLGEWKSPVNGFMQRAMIRQGLPRKRVVVPPGKLYVLGDNMVESVDSRTYGPVDAKDVVAVATDVDSQATWTLAGGHIGPVAAL